MHNEHLNRQLTSLAVLCGSLSVIVGGIGLGTNYWTIDMSVNHSLQKTDGSHTIKWHVCISTLNQLSVDL